MRNSIALAATVNRGSELYDQGTGVWSCGPQTPVQLYNASDEELGAAVMMYNGKVFQFGGNVVATAVYDVSANTWSAGPDACRRFEPGRWAVQHWNRTGKCWPCYSPGSVQHWLPVCGVRPQQQLSEQCPESDELPGGFFVRAGTS